MLHINKGLITALCLLAYSGICAGQLQLRHENNDFYVDNDQGSFQVQRCYVDKELRGVSSDHLAKYLASGAYLAVKKLDNSTDYAVHLNGRLNGGGPFVGKIAYFTVKVGGYIGLGIAMAFHPNTAAEAPHIKEAIDAAANAAEAVGSIIPGP